MSARLKIISRVDNSLSRPPAAEPFDRLDPVRLTSPAGIAEQIERNGNALTVKQLAAILQCSPKLLYKMVEARTIPHYKVGVLVRFCPSDTAKWIRSRKCGRRF